MQAAQHIPNHLLIQLLQQHTGSNPTCRTNPLVAPFGLELVLFVFHKGLWILFDQGPLPRTFALCEWVHVHHSVSTTCSSAVDSLKTLNPNPIGDADSSTCVQFLCQQSVQV